MTNPISRRAVLKGIAIGVTSPAWIRYADTAFAATQAAPSATPNSTRHLLVVFLRGGNDPLRTIAPIDYDALQKLRPNVGLRATEAFALGNGYGINHAIPSFYEAWRAGQLAVVQQTGPIVADYSHGTAARKWESGHPDERFATGWLGRYLDVTPAAGPVRAVAFGDTLPLTLVGQDADALSMRYMSGFKFADRKYKDAAARHNALAHMASSAAPKGSVLDTIQRSQRELLGMASPLTELASSTINGARPTGAQSAAQLFAANLGTEISFVNVTGFDTHVAERGRHTDALSNLNEVVHDFFQMATSLGVAQNSAVLVLSEFGRRVYENTSGGTDHGYGTNVYLLGPGVRGGFYGPTLDLSQLEDGNLPVRIDLRTVYASVLSGWLHTNPAPVLGGEFGTLPLFR